MSYRTSEDFANETGPTMRLLKGMIRRMAIKLTSSGARWQLLGYRGPGGDETPEIEPFTGIGFYSRPPSSGKPEAVVVAAGGQKTRMIVATRDEATRKKVANLAENETAIFNDVAQVVVHADGTIEIKLTAGTTEPTIKGTTYRSAENTLINAITTALAAINTYAVAIKAVADPTNAATPALTTALTTTWTAAVSAFQAAAASYLSTVAKVQ